MQICTRACGFALCANSQVESERQDANLHLEVQICTATGAVNLHSCVWICTLTANLHVNVSFSLLVVAFLLPWPRERSGSAATPSVQRLVNQPSYITICVTAVRDAARLSTPAPRGHPRRAGSRASGRYDPDPHLLLVQYFLCPLVLVKHSYNASLSASGC